MYNATVFSPRHNLLWWGCLECDALFGYNEGDELKALWQRGVSGREGKRISDIPEGNLAVIDEYEAMSTM
jgi:hypothetical protein